MIFRKQNDIILIWRYGKMSKTIEDSLKDLILTRYKSIREFTTAIEMPYSTMDTILKRGLNKASIGNVIKICRALDISTDELANGRIMSNGDRKKLLEEPEFQDRLSSVASELDISTDELNTFLKSNDKYNISYVKELSLKDLLQFFKENYCTSPKEYEFPPEIRAAARGMMDLPLEKQKTAIEMIKFLSQKGKEAKKD